MAQGSASTLRLLQAEKFWLWVQATPILTTHLLALQMPTETQKRLILFILKQPLLMF